MGSSIFSIGVSGLNAAQAGLTTTQHNIANANTPGYNRQQIVQSTDSTLCSTALKSASASDSSGSNSFSGSIPVTVTEVLSNGNLIVAGEKQVEIKHSEEFVRFSGVVSPTTFSSSNTVQSTQVADVHVEYRGASISMVRPYRRCSVASSSLSSHSKETL